MNTTSKKTLTLTIEQATTLAANTLIANQTSPTNAKIVANALVKAEVEQQGGHGISRLLTYAPQSNNGKVNGHAMPSTDQISANIVRISAQNGFAFPALNMAVEALEKMLPESGLALAGICNSHHFGQAGAPCEALAKKGFVAIIFGNTPVAMPIPPSNAPILGTNPIAFAAPIAEQPPLVIDMALSQVARGRIIKAQMNNEPISTGWAIDANGDPTTEPDKALNGGSLLPLGGQKGALLALMVEILSACLLNMHLSTEASSLLNDKGDAPNIGQTILAIDPLRISSDGFFLTMNRLIENLKQNDVHIPGSNKASLWQQALKNGITIDEKLYKKIQILNQ